MILWANGRLIPEDEVRISPFDQGLLRGWGAFETLRCYRGIPFAWRRHLERLSRSADRLGLPAPEEPRLREAAGAVLESNGLSNARMRITIAGGRADPGTERPSGSPTVILSATSFVPAPAVADVVVVPWPRNERGALAGAKSTSYAENMLALTRAVQRGAHEAVFANTRGDLCEGSASNLFLVEGERVVTPPLESGCLDGVTRALVLELCPGLGIEAAEAGRPASALAESSEAFLTSTIREVQPIAHADGRALPAAPGPVTAALAEAFRALVARDLDP